MLDTRLDNHTRAIFQRNRLNGLGFLVGGGAMLDTLTLSLSLRQSRENACKSTICGRFAFLRSWTLAWTLSCEFCACLTGGTSGLR